MKHSRSFAENLLNQLNASAQSSRRFIGDRFEPVFEEEKCRPVVADGPPEACITKAFPLAGKTVAMAFRQKALYFRLMFAVVQSGLVEYKTETCNGNYVFEVYGTPRAIEAAEPESQSILFP